jgi:hypothetical protein
MQDSTFGSEYRFPVLEKFMLFFKAEVQGWANETSALVTMQAEAKLHEIN